MSNDKTNLTSATMPNVPEYRRNFLTPALEAVFGNNKDGNGSPMGGALIPILLIGVVLIVYFIMRSRSGGMSFDQLKPNSQNAVNNFLQFQNMIQFTVDNNTTQFTATHYLLNNLQSGIVLTNATQNIYITYYEYLNWYSKGGTLSIPVRTLSNNALTDSTTAGYSLYYDTVADVLKITSLTAATTSSVQYTDANNASQTITPTSEPDIQTSTAGTITYTEFVPKSSLNLSSQDLSGLSFAQNMLVAMPISYNSGTQSSPSTTNVPLQFSELTINGSQVGYQFVSADQSVKIYMTYREFLNTPFKLPLRSIINNEIVNDFSDGYVLVPNTQSPGLTIYRLSTKVPASHVRIMSIPNLNTDSRGGSYPFYVTYDMLGIDNETIVNTFIGRQDLIQYSFNGSSISFTAAHLSLNNVQVGVQLSNTAQNLTIYLSYNEILNWLLSDFTSPGANASIIIPQRVIGSSSSLQVVISSTTDQYTLAFDPTNNAQINITAGAITINNSLVEYNDMTQTPATVVIDANTGWKINTDSTDNSGTGGTAGGTTGGGTGTGGGSGSDTGFVPKDSLGLSSDDLMGLSILINFIGTLPIFYNSGTQTSPNPADIPLQGSELTINGVQCGFQFVSQDQSIAIYMTYNEFLSITNPTMQTQLPLRSIINNAVVNDFSNGYLLVPHTPTGPNDTGSIKFYKLSA